MSNQKGDEHFVCAKCGMKLPVKRLFSLNNFSKIECPHCGTINSPDIVGPWTFVTAFLAVVASAKTSLIIKDNILIALSIGLLFGVIAYLLIALYIYKTIKFHKVI
jgi:DNA-directed RNA polymerase subunit RPC12/RpoP